MGVSESKFNTAMADVNARMANITAEIVNVTSIFVHSHVSLTTFQLKRANTIIARFFLLNKSF